MNDDMKSREIPVTRSELFQHWQKRMEGNDLTSMVVRYKDADYFEHEDPTLDPDTVIYELTLKESTPEEGHLNWGHLTINPGLVEDEYFCTRGHFHSTPNTEEYILCMMGTGLIMYLNKDGDCWCEELEEGSLHHIPEGVARRIINLGDTPLSLSLCRPANAGFNTTLLEDIPFPCHVYDDQGDMAIRVDVEEKHSDDSDPSQEEIEALLKFDPSQGMLNE